MTQAISELDSGELTGKFSKARAFVTPNCPRCGSAKCHWRGFRFNRTTTVHRRRCAKCGKWFLGKGETGQVLIM